MLSRIMKTYHYLGIRNARLRDYIVGHAEEAKHMVSTRKLASYSELTQTIKMHNDPGYGIKAIMFVKVEHLPDDLMKEMKEQEGYENFSEFCDLIGFATVLHFNSASDSTQTMVPLSGFPLPAPIKKVENRQRDEFTSRELLSFMGDLFPYAGRAIVVELGPEGPSSCARTIFHVFNKFVGVLDALE